MEEPRFATWKYEYKGPGQRNKLQNWLAAAAFAGGLFAWKILIPLAIFLFLIGLIAILFRRKKLMVSPRYVLCGERIVYFANVARIERNDAHGRLCLVSANGSRLDIERDKFPTNARKPDKVLRNKAAKFVKVADHLVERVRRAAPTAEIVVED